MASFRAISSIVGEVFSRYDHNRNGVIETRRPDTWQDKLRNADETHRSVMALRIDRDSLRLSSKVYSRSVLFAKADRDDDGKVTRAELEKVIRSFDKDGDGKLSRRSFLGRLFGDTKLEYDRFADDYGDKVSSPDGSGIDLG